MSGSHAHGHVPSPRPPAPGEGVWLPVPPALPPPSVHLTTCPRQQQCWVPRHVAVHRGPGHHNPSTTNVRVGPGPGRRHGRQTGPSSKRKRNLLCPLGGQQEGRAPRPRVSSSCSPGLCSWLGPKTTLSTKTADMQSLLAAQGFPVPQLGCRWVTSKDLLSDKRC